MDPTDTIVSAQPFVDLLLPYINAIVIGVFVPVFLAFALKKLGLDMEAKNREALQTSLSNAAGLLIQKAGVEAGAFSLDVKNEQMAAAIRYVQKSAPDAVAKWGLDPSEIAEKIRAKIPQAEGKV